MKNSKRVFSKVEEACYEYGLGFKIPSHIPNDCNIISYDSENAEDITFYMENKNGLYFYSVLEKDWKPTYNTSLEDEIYDDIENGYDYIYLRLEPNKEKFTPERLLGVETTKGYVVEVYKHEYTQLGFSLRLGNDKVIIHNPLMLKYYISDKEDDTVSFDKYIDMFYVR